MIGTKQADSSGTSKLKASSEPKAFLYVGNLDISNNAGAVSNYLEEANIKVLACETVCSRRSSDDYFPRATSVHVVIDVKDKEKALSPATWKTDIVVHPWRLHVNSRIKMIDLGGTSFHFSSMNFVTFNLHGFNNGNNFLKDLCTDNSIVCVQEHWLRSDQMYVLNNLTANFEVYAVSSIDDKVPPNFSGRPYGGLAVFVKRSICNILNLGSSTNFRVQALLLTISTVNILLFTVYFPCLCSSVDYNVDLNVICSFLRECIDSNNCNNLRVVTCGDFSAN